MDNSGPDGGEIHENEEEKQGMVVEEEDDNSGFHLEVSKIYLQDGTLKVGLLPNTSMTQSYYLTFPPNVGTANQVLTTDGNTGALSWTSNGTGNVHAPTTGNVQAMQVPVFSDTTGTNLANSTITIGNNGNIDYIKELSLRNSVGDQRIAIHAPPALGASYSIILPNNNGSSGEYLTTDGLGNLSWGEPSGSGNVNAPTDPVAVNTIPIFSNTTGTILGATPIEIDSSQQQIGKVKKLNIQNNAFLLSSLNNNKIYLTIKNKTKRFSPNIEILKIEETSGKGDNKNNTLPKIVFKNKSITLLTLLK